MMTMTNGDRYRVDDEEPQEIADRLDESRRDGTLTKLHAVKGATVWVNPHEVSSILHVS